MGYDPNQDRDNIGRWSAGGTNSIANKFSDSALDSLHRRSLKAPLSSEEKYGLQRYIDLGPDMNDMLRRETSRHFPHWDAIKGIDNAFRKASLAEPLTVLRAIDTEGFNKINKVGQIFSDKGFISTTIDDKIANYIAGSSLEGEFDPSIKVFKVQVPRNFSAIVLSPSVISGGYYQTGGHEWKEVLLNRGSRFKVIAPGIIKALP